MKETWRQLGTHGTYQMHGKVADLKMNYKNKYSKGISLNIGNCKLISINRLYMIISYAALEYV